MATKIIISEKQLKRIVNTHLQEDYWGDDQYAVIGAMEEIFQGMFAKVER